MAADLPGANGSASSKRTLSIRVRLMILALIAVVPLLIERIYTEQTDRTERVERAYRLALSLAHQGAAAQNEAIVSGRALLQSIASTRAAFGMSNSACNEFLRSIVSPVPWFKQISVINLRGQIVCSSEPRAIGLDISDRPHFTKAVDTGEFVLSDYFFAPRLEASVITIALAQRGLNGAAAAVISGVLDLSWFERTATNFVPASGSMLMIDGKGTVLARHPHMNDIVGKPLNDRPVIREILSRPEGFFTATGLDDVRRIYGHVQLPHTEARIVVGIDERDVVARANQAMWMAIAEVGAIAVLVLLAIWFGGERLLVQPIHSLAQTAALIGRSAERTSIASRPWAPEFMPLATALDEMAAKLSDREQQLRRSNAKLHELAQLDGLTGLPNRRTFDEQLEAAAEHAAKSRQPVAVLMIDVDFFKAFNDHYGHVQGDACLRKVSSVLKSATRGRIDAPSIVPDAGLPPSFHISRAVVRKPDFAARYGGEEFAVLLPGASVEGALVVGERLRQSVEDLLMAHAGTPWGFVSISVGAASAIPNGTDPHGLTEAADAALYEAKRQGRNRVVGFEPVQLRQAV